MNSQDFRLLKYFIANDSITIDELMANEHVSKRTMVKYLQDLNDNLSDIAEILEKQERYYLRVNDYQKLATLQTGELKRNLDFNDPNKRYAYIINRLMQSQDYVTLDDLAEALMISKTTLNRDIKDLRQRLINFHAEIFALTNNGIKLRIYWSYNAPIIFEHFVYDYYPPRTLKVEKDSFKLKQLCQALQISKHMTVQLEKNLAALYFAMQSGYRIKQPIPHFQRLWQMSSAIKSLKTVFEQIIGEAVTEFELDYLLSPLTFKANRLLSSTLIQQQIQVNSQLFKAVETKMTMDISLDFDHIYDQIKYHFLFLVNRAIFHSYTTNLLPGNILEQYPVASDLAGLTIQSLSDYLDVHIDQVEVGYLTIYFEMELEENQVGTSYPLEVAMVGQISESMVHFIQYRLKEIFDDVVNVTIFKDVQELNRQYGHYILIFSDVPIDYSDVTTPVVRISTAFRINELRSKMQVAFIEKAISEHSCEFTFELLSSKLSYLSATQQMIQKKIDSGSLTAEFLKSWKKREKQASNVFENGIAIPHVVDESGNQRILLSIGVFDQQIKYRDRKVRVIFLIGLPQKLDQQLNRVLSQVYDLVFAVANNKNIYQNLLDYDSKQPLTQITEGI